MTEEYVTSNSTFANTSTDHPQPNSTFSTEGVLFYYILWTIFAPAIFSLISIFGTLGNSLVIFVILSRRNMRTTTNLLLVNLAFSDAAFLHVCVTLTAYKFVVDQWQFGEVFCKTVRYMEYVCCYVTVYTLVVISLYRFFCVVMPTKSARFRTRRGVLGSIAVIWASMLVLHLPTYLAHSLKTIQGHRYCGMVDGAIKPHFVTFFALAYLLPLTAIVTLYLGILFFLLKRSRAVSTTLKARHTEERNSRTCRMVVIVVVVFGICWLPMHLHNMFSVFYSVPDGPCYEVLRILWQCMAYGSSCFNPLIYSYASAEFRTAFKDVARCRWCPEKRIGGSGGIGERSLVDTQLRQLVSK